MFSSHWPLKCNSAYVCGCVFGVGYGMGMDMDMDIVWNGDGENLFSWSLMKSVMSFSSLRMQIKEEPKGNVKSSEISTGGGYLTDTNHM